MKKLKVLLIALIVAQGAIAQSASLGEELESLSELSMMAGEIAIEALEDGNFIIESRSGERRSWNRRGGEPARWSQELDGGSQMTMEIIDVGDDITIRGHDGTEIIVETNDYEGIPEKAKGLKPLSATGEDNTEIGLYFGKSGDKYVLRGASRIANDADYVISIPKRMKLKVEAMRWSGGDVTIEGMTGEVEARSNVGDIELSNAGGPLVIWTLSSDITVMYDDLSQDGPHSISSTSGDIDLTLPGNSKGSFDMKSMSGEIYSNLDLQLPQKDGMDRYGGQISAKGTLNGGGVEFSVNSISGDVFMRKVQ